ncbi:hypothetical protein L7F22_052393 [Adiantum nelumboides]|nr:hypothetical protein [Adiantum nelumboides]
MPPRRSSAPQGNPSAHGQGDEVGSSYQPRRGNSFQPVSEGKGHNRGRSSGRAGGDPPRGRDHGGFQDCRVEGPGYQGHPPGYGTGVSAHTEGLQLVMRVTEGLQLLDLVMNSGVLTEGLLLGIMVINTRVADPREVEAKAGEVLAKVPQVGSGVTLPTALHQLKEISHQRAGILVVAAVVTRILQVAVVQHLHIKIMQCCYQMQWKTFTSRDCG